MIQGFSSLGGVIGIGSGIFLALVGVLGWKINQDRHIRRRHHQKVFEDLQQANVLSKQLNIELAREVEQRRLARPVSSSKWVRWRTRTSEMRRAERSLIKATI